MSAPDSSIPPDKLTEFVISEGWRLSQTLHKFIQDNPVNPMAQWPAKFYFLGFLTYATSMAKAVDMDRDDFLHLCEALYDNILATFDKQSTPKA